jgi:hypothetical protein
MRNLKKTWAIMLVIAMMVTTMIPAFADTETSLRYENEAESLNALGLYKGISEDEFDPDLESELDRQTGVIMLLRLFGSETEALEMTEEDADMILEDKFSDAADIADWAKKQVAYGVKFGYVNGYPDGTFRPDAPLNAKAYSTLILTQLGVDFDYNTAPADLYSAGGLSPSESIRYSGEAGNAPIIKDDLVGISFGALRASDADGKLVVVKLVESGYIEKAAALAEEVVTEDELEDEEVPDALATKMTEVKVTTEDTMVAMFDGKVETATFTVTGPMATSVTATWNEAKTEATLKNNSPFLDGVYTVKVAGGLVAEATVNVAKNGVTKIEIVGDKVIRIDDSKGIAYIKLYDSYGNDVTESKIYDVTINASSSSVIVTDSKKGEIEITTINASSTPVNTWLDYPPTPQLITLSAYSKTAVNGMVASASKTLSVTEKAKVEKVELGEVVLPSGYQTLQIKKSNAGYIVMKAYDQFVREVKDTAKLDPTNESSANVEVFYSVGNSTLKNQLTLAKETNSAGNDELRLKIDTTNLTTNDARPVNLSIVSKYRGVTSNTVVLDIKQGSEPYKVAFGAPSGVVAKYDDRGTDALMVVDLIVHDEEGNQLSADQIADKAGDGSSNSGSFTFSGFDTNNLSFKIATSGENKGKLEVKSVNTGTSTSGPNSTGSQTMTIYIKNGVTPSSSLTVDVKDKAEPRTIAIDEQPTSNLLFKSSTTFNYKILDQYGRELSDEMLQNTNIMTNATQDGGAYTTQFAVKLSTSDTTKATASFVTFGDLTKNDAAPFTYVRSTFDTSSNGKYIKDLNNSDAMKITAKEETGTVTVKAELVVITHNAVNTVFTTAHTSILSTATKSFFIADGIPSSMTFEIEAVPTLKGLTTTAALDNTVTNFTAGTVSSEQADRYAYALDIIAKDENGNEYTVPYGRITDITSSDELYVDLDKDGSDWYVFGKEAQLVTDLIQEKTATITALISTDSGPKTTSTTVKVTRADIKVQEIHFIDKNPAAAAEWNANYSRSMPETYNNVSEFAIGDVDNAAGANTEFWIVTKDQYGVYKVRNDATLTSDDTMTLNNTQDATFTEITIDNDGVAANNEILTTVASVYDLSNTNQFRQNKSLVFTKTIDGVSGQLTVRTGSTGVAEGTSLDKTAPTAAVLANLTVAATQVTGNASAAEAGATIKIVANNAGSAAISAGATTPTVTSTGSFAAITGLTTGTDYDLYVIDATGNVSAKLDITTP